MNTLKMIFSFLLIASLAACGSKKTQTQNPVMDTTSTNPTSNSQDYHPDQRQTIPSPDSSNVVGADTINASTATPNTGTQKTYNDAKGNKSKNDSSKH